jgi:hypothetical protein
LMAVALAMSGQVLGGETCVVVNSMKPRHACIYQLCTYVVIVWAAMTRSRASILI